MGIYIDLLHQGGNWTVHTLLIQGKTYMVWGLYELPVEGGPYRLWKQCTAIYSTEKIYWKALLTFTWIVECWGV